MINKTIHPFNFIGFIQMLFKTGCRPMNISEIVHKIHDTSWTIKAPKKNIEDNVMKALQTMVRKKYEYSGLITWHDTCIVDFVPNPNPNRSK